MRRKAATAQESNHRVRGPAYLGLIVATALVLAVLACGGGDDRVSEEWSVVFSKLPGALTSVWGTSADDIWAVGSDPNDGSGQTVLHFDGSQWSRLETGFSGDLWWVFGFEGGPVFIGGKNGLILRFEGGTFQRMDTPGTATVYGIWGEAPDDLWAVGGNVVSGAFAWRFDGSSWTQGEGFPSELAESESMFKVSGRAKDDVWIVGTGGVALHYDGRRFTREPSGTTQVLFTVHTSLQRYAAVGGFGGSDSGAIVENDGSRWMDVTPKGIPNMMGVWLERDLGYAVGVEGTVLRREGGDWKRVDTGIELAETLHAVWVDPEGGVWAVGGQVLAPPLADGVMIYRSPADDPS